MKGFSGIMNTAEKRVLKDGVVHAPDRTLARGLTFG